MKKSIWIAPPPALARALREMRRAAYGR